MRCLKYTTEPPSHQSPRPPPPLSPNALPPPKNPKHHRRHQLHPHGALNIILMETMLPPRDRSTNPTHKNPRADACEREKPLGEVLADPPEDGAQAGEGAAEIADLTLGQSGAGGLGAENGGRADEVGADEEVGAAQACGGEGEDFQYGGDGGGVGGGGHCVDRVV